ncbi:MAG: hypothetical protein K2F92_03185 [Alistipes sp.]|nr:hypothetical protein [Alistipes sp.]
MAEDNFTSLRDFFSDVEAAQQRDKQPNLTEMAARTLAANEKTAKDLSFKDKRADINLKWLYGIVILLILIGWEVFVIIFSFKQLNPNSLKIRPMSDAVLIALWTSATANIVALPAIILNYLFPKRK